MKPTSYKVFENNGFELSSGEKLSQVEFEILIKRTKNFDDFFRKLQQQATLPDVSDKDKEALRQYYRDLTL